jgi:hypothetical protein
MIATQMSRRPLALCARRAASRAGVYLAIAAGVTVFPQTAQAAVPLNLCVPAPDATGILRAVVGANPTVAQLPRLLLKDVHVRVTPSGYAVSSGGADATVPARHPPPGDPRRAACSLLGMTTVLLRDVPSLPGELLAAYGAVASFRTTFTWPRGAADLEDPTTALFLTRHDTYTLVTIVAPPKTRQLGCFEESYRVDIPSLAVRPYEGCVEGHPPSGLPRFEDLPPPNIPG